MSSVETARRAAQFLLRPLYLGPNQCNMCGHRVRFLNMSRRLSAELTAHGFCYSLDDFETMNHRRFVCPMCGAIDRDRLYRLYIDQFLGDDIGRVIEFAPSVTLSAYLRSRTDVQYRSADLMMAAADDKVDITDMPMYSDGSVDFFICSHILEHVSDDQRALDELYRILAPGGRGIVMTPIAPEGSFDEDPSVTDETEKWRRFCQGDHVRLYDRSTLCARIATSGFKVSALDHEAFGDTTFARHGISPKSVLYVAHKPCSDRTR